MLRKATADDLPALTALRCGAAKANPVDAAGWLQNVAGLENILVLEKNGQPAAMLAAVPANTSGAGLTIRPSRPCFTAANFSGMFVLDCRRAAGRLNSGVRPQRSRNKALYEGLCWLVRF